MKTLTALVCAKNEQDFIGLCLEHLIPYCDQIVVVDNGSDDKTREIALSYEKVELYDFPPTHDMSAVRNFSLSKCNGDFFLQCDPDEIYPSSEMRKIREFIETTDAISARVHYKNLSWRTGYAQKDFGHYPDRLYRRDVVEGYRGVLPVDMTYVKKEFLRSPNKTKGDIGPLEYDNDRDASEVHPKQPIIDVTYYHLARTRGYNFEYRKQMNYQRNLHPEWSEEQCRDSALINHWTTGRYEIEPVNVPDGIPKKMIPSPKISIIITNFEYENYVGEAIQSAINQTYKAHEIIVVDDCSYDRSREVIDRYSQHVRTVYRKENGGPAAARNEGIALSTGDYFLLLDADDRLKPDAIENLLKGGADVTYGNMESFGDKVEFWDMPEYTKERMLEAQVIPSVCALVDRHAFDCSGGFDITTYFEDYFFWLTLSERLGLTFKKVPYTTLEYRFHGSEQKCRSDHCNPHKEKARAYFKQYFPNLKWL